MGQYYNPCILKKNWKQANNPVEKTLKCYDFDNGAKLMEHSYAGNNFVGAVMYLLATDYFGRPFVWCGDYADSVKTNTGEHDIYQDGQHFLYGKNEEWDKSPSYKKFFNRLPKVFTDGEAEEIPYYRFIVNLSKKQFVEVPKFVENQWNVHPLPLLTCEGNGAGGGDYRICANGYDYRKDVRIGLWAFDRIGATNDIAEYLKKGFKVIDGHFLIDW